MPMQARRLKPLLVLMLLLGLLAWWQTEQSQHTNARHPATAGASVQARAKSPAFLPPEAIHTLALIRKGGPYPFRQDDGVFGNREHMLPARARGYYHEYTVVTPGAGDRGARRIVTGGTPPSVYYYSNDHYRSFRRFEVRP
ncbi:MAG: ribonuclease domain-containing protein [Rhodanobacteraceae bacterium]